MSIFDGNDGESSGEEEFNIDLDLPEAESEDHARDRANEIEDLDVGYDDFEDHHAGRDRAFEEDPDFKAWNERRNANRKPSKAGIPTGFKVVGVAVAVIGVLSLATLMFGGGSDSSTAGTSTEPEVAAVDQQEVIDRKAEALAERKVEKRLERLREMRQKKLAQKRAEEAREAKLAAERKRAKAKADREAAAESTYTAPDPEPVVSSAPTYTYTPPPAPAPEPAPAPAPAPAPVETQAQVNQSTAGSSFGIGG